MIGIKMMMTSLHLNALVMLNILVCTMNYCPSVVVDDKTSICLIVVSLIVKLW